MVAPKKMSKMTVRRVPNKKAKENPSTTAIIGGVVVVGIIGVAIWYVMTHRGGGGGGGGPGPEVTANGQTGSITVPSSSGVLLAVTGGTPNGSYQYLFNSDGGGENKFDAQGNSHFTFPATGPVGQGGKGFTFQVIDQTTNVRSNTVTIVAT
jgi:hypothetical protein